MKIAFSTSFLIKMSHQRHLGLKHNISYTIYTHVRGFMSLAQFTCLPLRWSVFIATAEDRVSEVAIFFFQSDKTIS